MAKKTRSTSPIFLDDMSKENANSIYIRSHRRRIVFGWYGGKFSHLDWLLPLLPECHHYCEPFAGSGAVLLNRVPSPVETYNDMSVYKMTGKLKQLVGIGFCILPWGITVGVQSRYKSSKMRSNRHF